LDRKSPSVTPSMVAEWREGQFRHFEDSLVGEEPLEIRLNHDPVTVTMRTPGHDLELAAGFLFAEGIVQRREEIAGLKMGENGQAAGNVVCVDLRNGAGLSASHSKRNFIATSSCGLCGKSSIDQIRVRGLRSPNTEFRLSPDALCELPDRLRAAQPVFERTGGLHAAAVFDERGELLALREDVGRHNAVDKVVGWALLEGHLPLSQHTLLVSGRGGFEIIQKALTAGFPVVASISAPSSLAVELAREFGLTLVGFLRGKRFVIYSGRERLL